MGAESQQGIPAKDGKGAPLLGDHEAAEVQTRFWRNWWTSLRLAVSMVGLLVSSVGNTVFFKKMTNSMPNYGFYLTQISTVIYVPMFMALAGPPAFTKLHINLLPKYAVMAIFDGLSGTLMVLGGVHTGGTLQVMLGQAIIPVTMFMSAIMVGKRYHILQLTGAAIIVLGLVLAKAASGSSDTDDVAIFNLIFFMGLVPSAMSSVYKELAFRSFAGDLDVNVIQFWVSFFQIFTNLAGMPIYTLDVLGPQKVPFNDMVQSTIGGNRCLLFREDQIVDQCGFAGERTCDHCEFAWTAVLGYLFFNASFNIFTMLVIKYGSAALCFLVSTLRMPLSAVAFSCPLIMGARAVQPKMSDFVSLGVILTGLVTYRYGGQLQHRRQLEPCSSFSFRRSPSMWFSPSSWSSPNGVVNGTRRRWKFMPMFVAGNLGLQPDFVLVPTVENKYRSPERIRSDMYRRLGVATKSPDMEMTLEGGRL
mmetsp:Transcript_129837/g.258996  ORF Transcript_129837/g.258996 Transcript_129837/m.258996 type:complete len:475 (-) Transcript_129837:9-1433(-)